MLIFQNRQTDFFCCGMERFKTEQLNGPLKHETAAGVLSAPATLFLASTDDIFLLSEVVPFLIK